MNGMKNIGIVFLKWLNTIGYKNKTKESVKSNNNYSINENFCCWNIFIMVNSLIEAISNLSFPIGWIFLHSTAYLF